MTDTKIQGIFNGFTNLESTEFKVPIVCLVFDAGMHVSEPTITVHD